MLRHKAQPDKMESTAQLLLRTQVQTERLVRQESLQSIQAMMAAMVSQVALPRSKAQPALLVVVKRQSVAQVTKVLRQWMAPTELQEMTPMLVSLDLRVMTERWAPWVATL